MPFPEISDNKVFIKCKCGMGSITLEFDRPLTLGDFFPQIRQQLEAREKELAKTD
jgi:hypothetical protein